MRRLPPPLLAVSPGTLARGPVGGARAARLAAFPRAIGALVAAGVRGLLLREPHLEDGAFLALARSARAVLEADGDGLWLGIHDRVHLAAAAGADGVQLAGSSLAAAEARAVVGPSLSIGVSTHDGDGPERWEDADFVLHAPVFQPLSKAGTAPPVGPDGLEAFCSSCDLPVWALGGVDLEGLQRLGGTGASGAACIGAIWGRPGAEGEPARPAASVPGLVAAARETFGGPEGGAG